MFGLGHISRMVNLADQLSTHEIFFQVDGKSRLEFISKSDIELHSLYSVPYSLPLSYLDLQRINLSSEWLLDVRKIEQIIKQLSIDMLICDLPGINQIWIDKLRQNVKVVVFDDLPVTNICADLVINPNNAHDYVDRYSSYIKEGVFIGQEYNPVHNKYKQSTCSPKTSFKKILVYLGSGVDFQTIKRIIESVIFETDIEVIEYIGEHADRISSTFHNSSKLQTNEFEHNFQKKLIDFDICIGACGVSFWERCHFGIPSIILKTAENQVKDIHYLKNTESIIEVKKESLESDIKEIFGLLRLNPDFARDLSRKSYGVVVGSYTNNVSDLILSKI